ncbi:ankyrin repeat and fibronectin type-III domain-containing protein 1 [Tachysurus ichikawai]
MRGRTTGSLLFTTTPSHHCMLLKVREADLDFSPRCFDRSKSKISHLAQSLNQRQRDAALIKDFHPPLFFSVSPGSSQSLDRSFCVRMTQQMQNLQLSHSKKGAAPASPNAAKRLYRNLSEKFKGSHSSFEDAYFFGRSDRIRKGSNIQSSEALFEAVEQQDLDAVQILLFQYTADELDLNTPNSEGLTPLDISIMTNNVPIAKLLLKAGAKESPHCEYSCMADKPSAKYCNVYSVHSFELDEQTL